METCLRSSWPRQGCSGKVSHICRDTNYFFHVFYFPFSLHLWHFCKFPVLQSSESRGGTHPLIPETYHLKLLHCALIADHMETTPRTWLLDFAFPSVQHFDWNFKVLLHSTATHPPLTVYLNKRKQTNKTGWDSMHGWNKCFLKING